MLYIITLAAFLIWSIWAIRKGHMSLHAVTSIYFVTLFAVDFGDVPFDFWFNFYDLNVHLLDNLDVGRYLGIILSDGLLFPLYAIIFCYYSVRYHHPWLLSTIFSGILGILEVIYVKLGYMVYHHWNHWITPVLTFIGLRLLAHYSNRFVNYTPPVSYRFRLICSVYTISEWPGAILAGSLHLFLYIPGIFADKTADSRFVAMIIGTVMGILAAIFAPKIQHSYKFIFFISLGLFSAFFAMWMYLKGLMVYNRWNHVLKFIRYTAPYILVYLYDRWESAYSRQFLKSTA